MEGQVAIATRSRRALARRSRGGLKAAAYVSLLFAQVLFAQNTPQIKQLATGTGVVMGRVVDAASGAPIAEAIVTLEPDPQLQSENAEAIAQPRQSGDFMSLSDMMPRANRVLTDDDGVFVFRDVRKGSLRLHAEASGYLRGEVGQERFHGPSSVIGLAEGGRMLDLKIKLWRGAVISGTVVDDRNEPAIGALVHAYTRGRPDSRLHHERSSATTDDRGMYRFSGLEPGDYIVGISQSESTMPTASIDAMLQAASSMVGDMRGDMRSFGDAMATGAGGPGQLRLGEFMLMSRSGITLPPGKDGRINIYESVFFPGAQRVSQATPLHVEAGDQRSGVDLQLRLVPTSTVSGLVLGPSGAVRNAPVRLEPAAAEVSGFESEIASTTTKADGTFVMLGVPDGQYIAKVMVEPVPDNIPDELKSNPMVQAIIGLSNTSKTPLFGQAAVAVNGANVPGVTITAGEGASLSGRVQFEARSKQPDPRALQQMHISLMPAGDVGDFGVSSGESRVNADLSFKTSHHPPGRYWVEVFPGDFSWIPKSVMVDGHNLLREAIDLPGKETSDVVITLTDKPSEIAGTVRSGTGSLPEHVVVVIFPEDFRAWIASGLPRNVFATVPVPKAGAYGASRLLSGDYLVAAIAGDENFRFSDPKFIESVARLASHVSIGEGDRKTLDLRLLDIKR